MPVFTGFERFFWVKNAGILSVFVTVQKCPSVMTPDCDVCDVMCVLCVSRSMWRALAGQKSKTMDGQTTGVRCDASLAYPPLPPWDDSIHSFSLSAFFSFLQCNR